MPKSDLNVIEVTLRQGCSPVNLLHICRRLFPKSIFGGLLLKELNDTFSVFSVILF